MILRRTGADGRRRAFAKTTQTQRPRRIWEGFLTEHDKFHAAHWNKRPTGFGASPALLLIDLYRWAFGDKPEPLSRAIARWPASCGIAAWSALPTIQYLLATARDARIPIIHVTRDDTQDGIEPWDVHSRPQEIPVDPQEMAREGQRWEIVPEVAPRTGETVLRKSAPSAFWGTPLAGHLNYCGVDTIIVAGETTSGCVRATVVEAAAYRYRVIVPEECVFDRCEASHAMSLFDMNQKYADVVSLEDVVRRLRLKKAPA